jgi:hypothetical protein
MPKGKPAGIRCIQLDSDNMCKIFGSTDRPAVCGSLQPSVEMCGQLPSEAFEYLEELEKATAIAPHLE